MEEVRDLGVISPTRIYEAGLYPNMECDLWLRISVDKEAFCRLSYSTDGRHFKEAGGFKANRGAWMGAKLGFYSITPPGIRERGWIDIMTSDSDLR